MAKNKTLKLFDYAKYGNTREARGGMWIGMTNLGYDPDAEIDNPENVQWYWIPDDGTVMIDTSRYGGTCMDLYNVQRCDEYGNVLPGEKAGALHKVRTRKWSEKQHEWVTVKQIERNCCQFHNMDFEPCLFATKREDTEKMRKWSNGYHRDNYKTFYMNLPVDGGNYVNLETRRAEKTKRNQEIVEKQNTLLRKRERGKMYNSWSSGDYPIIQYVEKEFGEKPKNRLVVQSALFHTYPYKFDELKAKQPEAAEFEDSEKIYEYARENWGQYGEEIIRQFMSEAGSSFRAAYYNSIGGDFWIDRDGNMCSAGTPHDEKENGLLYVDENGNLKRQEVEAA